MCGSPELSYFLRGATERPSRSLVVTCGTSSIASSIEKPRRWPTGPSHWARKIFNFGIERDLVENNPCHKIRPPARERSRDRVLTDDELLALWKALSAEEAAGRYLIANYFRIRLLTAQRGREVLRMRWRDICQEPAGSVWVIPGEVAKNGHSHRVPLSPQVVELLKAIGVRLEEDRRRANQWRETKGEPLRQPSEWVFPSPRGRAPMANIQKAFERLRRESAGARFRHTISAGQRRPG